MNMKLAILAFVSVASISAATRAELPREQDVSPAATQEQLVANDGDRDSSDDDTTPLAGYDGGFFIDSADGEFSLKIKGRGQVRYALDRLERGVGRPSSAAFAAERVRIDLSGHAFADNIQYKLQSDFGKGFVTIKDMTIDYGISDHIWLRAGQFKRPFSRQQITSSGRQELVDRAITDRFFGAGRDIGVALHNRYTHSPRFEWIVGVFNGSGDRPVLSGDVVVDPDHGRGQITGGGFSTVPDDMAPAVVARFGYNRGGIRGYSEADLEGGPLRFGVAASVLARLDASGNGQGGVRSGIDYVVKHRGLSITGGVYLASAQVGAGSGSQPYPAVGFHAQSGYVFADRFGVTARYAHIVPKNQRSEQELSLGVSVYQFSHNFKWQTDVSALSGGALHMGDHLRLRSQLQLSF